MFSNALRKTTRQLNRSAIALILAVAAGLTGCASGSSSESGSGVIATPPAANPNAPSLPPLTAATPVNTYVGTQAQSAASPTNVVSLLLDQTASTYTYADVALPNTQPDPVPNSNGLVSNFLDFSALGDITGVFGQGGPQYFGMASEMPSRFAFFAPNTGQQLGAAVPKQITSCVTPTAAATYQFITLFNSAFVPATDAVYGTFSLSATGSAFSFTGAQQFTESTAAASTALIPFAPSTCGQSSANPELGYFIDAPASADSNGVEMRAFLGPTGLLVADLQGTDSNGNPLALPGVLGMVQPSAPVDLAAVTGSAATSITYRAFYYQPAGSPAVQYGIAGQNSQVLNGVDNSIFTSTGTQGIQGIWQGLTSFTANQSASASGGGGVIFGAQDPKNPGLFPNAQFLYASTSTGTTCPTGTTYVAGSYCSSPAVAMVGLHDGKYVVLVTGLNQSANGTPAVLVLAQD